MPELVIDFAKLGGPVFAGRPKGIKAREQLGLDEIDSSDATVVKVLIPADTYSLNSSYFLGLFGESVRAAGGRDEFLAKFIFEAPGFILSAVDEGVARALLESKPF